jgi:UDP-N-acetylglucosamine 2-epimerase (non-hydrolysing)
LTFGDRTERPATVSKGTNRLVGRDPHAVVAEALRVLRGGGNGGGVPPMWDGQAAHRLVARLLDDREEVLERYRHVRITNQCTTPSTHPE